jgi:type III secretory pathway component EscT
MQELLALLGGESVVVRHLAVGALVAARLVPLALFAPFFALRASPTLLRTAVALALSVALEPLAAASAPALPGALGLAALSLREALVGTLFAVAASLPLHALDWLGRLVDGWRGAGQGEVSTPGGERTSPLGALTLLLGVAIFVTIGGHRLALAAFADGLTSSPVGAVSTVATVRAVALGGARLIADALTFAAALAAPAAVALVTVEVALGLVARATPQIPVFFAGMPLRAAVGLAAVLLSLSLVVERLPSAFRASIGAARGLVSQVISP